MNLFLKSFVYGTVGVAGAYVLNLIFDYTDNNLTTWLFTYVAFLVGSYIGLSYRAKKDKKSS